MKIAIDLDELMLSRLDRVAEEQGGRDMLIWRALSQWFTRQDEKTREEQRGKPWPEEILNFKGIPDMVPFESYRDELLPPKDDPFA